LSWDGQADISTCCFQRSVRPHEPMTVHALNSPTDTVTNGPELVQASLTDFWKWAMADLCDDDVKGWFAEWLVLKLLGIESRRRVSWANSDVVTESGVRIEVKATAYWQSWKVLDEFGKPKAERSHQDGPDSSIRFRGLRARDSSGVTDMAKDRALKSDLYVFAFQHERDIVKWNAMDLSQWEFYVLTSVEVASITPARTVSLARLRSVQRPLSAEAFVRVALEKIGVIARSRNDRPV
jgi:hypothetical protein